MKTMMLFVIASLMAIFSVTAQIPPVANCSEAGTLSYWQPASFAAYPNQEYVLCRERIGAFALTSQCTDHEGSGYNQVLLGGTVYVWSESVSCQTPLQFVDLGQSIHTFVVGQVWTAFPSVYLPSGLGYPGLNLLAVEQPVFGVYPTTTQFRTNNAELPPNYGQTVPVLSPAAMPPGGAYDRCFLQFSIPNSPSFLGARLAFQSARLDLSTSLISLSDAWMIEAEVF